MYAVLPQSCLHDEAPLPYAIPRDLIELEAPPH